MKPEDLVFSKKEFPRGRMTFEGINQDADEWFLEFLVPSLSRPSTIYGIIVRVDEQRSGEYICGCEAYRYLRDSMDDAARYGTRREWSQGWDHPDILREDPGLCPHGRLVKRWLKRHKEVMPFIDGTK